jgi:LPXTG-motif cell wall-anchored protein
MLLLALMAMMLFAALASPLAKAQEDDTGNPNEECPAGTTFLVKVEGQGPFSETVDGVTISGTIEGDTITFETDPPTPVTLVVKSGQNVEFFGPAESGTFTNETGQDISNVQFCLAEDVDDDGDDVTPDDGDDVTPDDGDDVVVDDDGDDVQEQPVVTKDVVVEKQVVVEDEAVVEKQVVVEDEVVVTDTNVVTEEVVVTEDVAAAAVLPETGGTGGTSLLALGAGALLVAGGLLARRILR